MLFRVNESTLHYIISKGRIPTKVEMVMRKRIRPRDVGEYMKTRESDYRWKNMEKARLVSLANRRAKRDQRRLEKLRILQPIDIRDNPDKRDERVLSDIDRVP